MEKQVSNEKLQNILKNNPEFAKSLASREAIRQSTNPTRVFDHFTDAAGALGLLKAITVDGRTSEDGSERSLLNIPKNSPNLGSGIIQSEDELFSYLVGKKNVSIALDKLELDHDVFKIDTTDLHKETIVEYNKPFSLLRVLIIKNDNGVFETVDHFDFKDLSSAGKHYVIVKDLGEKNLGLKVFFDLNFEAGTIKFASKFATNEALPDPYPDWYVVPLLISAETEASTLDLIKTSWDNKKQDFLDKLTKDYSEEQKAKIIAAIEENKLFDNLDYFDRGAALYDIDNNLVLPISNAIEANTGNADILDIVSSLFPKYGDEYIDLKERNVTIDEATGLPLLNKEDLGNLKIVGVDSQFITSMVETARTVFKTADDLVTKYTKDEVKRITSEAYDAECRLILDLENGTNISTVLDGDDYKALKAHTDMENETDLASKNKTDIIQQLASLQLSSRRIKDKVSHGEFTNMYMQLCNSYFDEYYNSIFKEDETNISAFAKLLKLFNNDFKVEKEFISKKLETVIENTIKCNDAKDRFGNEAENLFEKVSKSMDLLVDAEAVPNNLPEDEKAKRLMDISFIRYNYIDSLSRTPFKLISKLEPRILKAASSEFNAKADQEKSKSEDFRKLFKAFDIEDQDNWMVIQQTKIDKIVKKIEDLREQVKTAIESKHFEKIEKDQVAYLKKVGETKTKNTRDIARVFGRYAVVFNNINYAHAINTGLSPITNFNIEDLNDTDYTIIDAKTEKSITLSEYKALDDNQKKAFAVNKKLTDEEKIDIGVDYMLRLTFTSAFFIEFLRQELKYANIVDDAVKNGRYKNSDKVDSDKMFVSELGLMVPSISVLEIAEIKEDNTVDLSTVVPTENKIKLGTNAVDDVLKDLDKGENLIKARKEYVSAIIEFLLNTI